MSLNHDRQITISAAGSRRAVKWQTRYTWWSDLVAKLAIPAQSPETLTEYLRLPKAKQDDLKDAGGFIGGALKGGRRKADAVLGRDVITLDLDNIDAGGTYNVLQRIEGLGCAYCCYSTRKHENARPRIRVLIPTSRTVTAEEYEAIARKLAEIIGMRLCDPTTFEPSRLMYWPSVCKGAPYVYIYGDKPFADADGILNMYSDWREVASWPRAESEPVKHAAALNKQGDPCTKSGLVGAFCRVYDIYRALDTFLPDAYTAVGADPDRLTYAGGSTTGGAVIYDGGKFLYSNHATDPASGRLCNAFDLVRLHLFNDLDADAPSDAPVNRLPSYGAMTRFAAADALVSSALIKERADGVKADFAEIGNAEENAPPDEWLKKLNINPNTGKPSLCIDNVVLILENDERLKKRIILNCFENLVMVAAPLPWDAAESFRERTLDKNDGAGLRRHLERYYSITGKDRIEDALLCYAGDHKIHPVKDYLLSLKWDGTPRLDTLFIDYFGAEDNVYNRAVARKSFTAAVARVMEPGTKKDEMTVLIGEQGTGKSTLLRTLGKAWYSNGIKSFDGKNAAELLQGVWISEIEEMSAYRRGEINLIKSFVSTSEDHYREAYASRAGKYPRQCVFFGTTNSDEFLRDDTGERRFWPVKLGVKKATKSVFKDLKNDVDQLWAEAYLRYLLGESLILAGEARKAATIYQDEFSVKSPREGLILDFLDKDIPKNWDKLAAPQRLLFLKSEFNADAAELEKRVKVSALEVYLECFGGDIKSCKTSDIQEINAVIRKTDAWEYRSIRTIYGTAKGWARKNA